MLVRPQTVSFRSTLTCRTTIETAVHAMLYVIDQNASEEVDARVVHALRRSWSQVYVGLLALRRMDPKYASALDIWRVVVQQREDWEASRRAAAFSLRGCGWSQCPLYQSVSIPLHWEMLRCTGCETVSLQRPNCLNKCRILPQESYCSLFCQKR